MTERLCISCRTTKEKGDMIKITRIKDGEIIISPNSKQTGYSAYICKNKVCIDNAVKRNKLEKALKTNLPFDKEILLKELYQYLP